MEGTTLWLTSLFDWYASDYIEEEGSVLDFITAYADDGVKAMLGRHQRIRFIDYDRGLNKPTSFPEFWTAR